MAFGQYVKTPATDTEPPRVFEILPPGLLDHCPAPEESGIEFLEALGAELNESTTEASGLTTPFFGDARDRQHCQRHEHHGSSYNHRAWAAYRAKMLGGGGDEPMLADGGEVAGCSSTVEAFVQCFLQRSFSHLI